MSRTNKTHYKTKKKEFKSVQQEPVQFALLAQEFESVDVANVSGVGGGGVHCGGVHCGGVGVVWKSGRTVYVL